jgi:hypothetical protein
MMQAARKASYPQKESKKRCISHPLMQQSNGWNKIMIIPTVTPYSKNSPAFLMPVTNTSMFPVKTSTMVEEVF